MIFVLSGEGPTDIGKIDYKTRKFDPGPMTYFIDSIVQDILAYSPIARQHAQGNILHFIHRSDLIDKDKRKRMILPSKNIPKGTAYFQKNASTLGNIAKGITEETGLSTVAVLFRDADPTRAHDDFEMKRTSMEKGFQSVGYSHGVPMIPRQSMEAWLLDSYDWQGASHGDFEYVTGGSHSSNPFKKQLSELLGDTSQQALVGYVIDGTLDQSRISAESYKLFKERLIDVLDSITDA